MKERYCYTKLGKLMPCNSGWGACGTEGCHFCHAEPMEENCRNIVDTQYMACPYCGSDIGEKEEHLFGDNIRDAIHLLRH